VEWPTNPLNLLHLHFNIFLNNSSFFTVHSPFHLCVQCSLIAFIFNKPHLKESAEHQVQIFQRVHLHLYHYHHYHSLL
jgi:hypothetical protein